MRKSRFTEEQIVGVVEEAERTGKTGEVIRHHGTPRETFYRPLRSVPAESQQVFAALLDSVPDAVRREGASLWK